ncbi:MAG: arginine utilization protein RocB, partial [Pseudomonadota bacterium]|nr:arginine utilization protein RocB [Pseudomonadota bacterium]
MNKALAARAAEWTFELVAMPSVNGTADEATFALALRDRLAALPIFAADPDAVWLIPVPDDPLGRASVAALLRGEGARTVILTGHFDTVRVDDYGDLCHLATQPRELREALRKRLARSAATPAERLALADLESGEFLPGRGMLDMKSGLAAGLAALEAFAGVAERPGNVLFLA